MRIPNAVHEAHPWRIREIAHDFAIEDVWALPVHGDADDFRLLLEIMATLDFPGSSSLPTRVLWRARDLLGRWCGLGRISAAPDGAAGAAPRLPIPGTTETSLAERLPADLRGTADPELGAPFAALYRTDDEYAAELSNRTVHAVLHLAWVDRGDGVHQGRLAVYVKPRGPNGRVYMVAIKPLRHHIVYPALMRHLERAWGRRLAADRLAATPRP